MKLFGFQITRPSDNVAAEPSTFSDPVNMDGSLETVYTGLSGFIGRGMDIDAIPTENETLLINRYRELSQQSPVEKAIDDIINEALSYDGDALPITINLQDIEGLPDRLKDVIRQEFENILYMMNFKEDGYEIFKRWYVDGRLYYHKVIDNTQPQAGIIELRYIDPRKIRKVRERVPSAGQPGSPMNNRTNKKSKSRKQQQPNYFTNQTQIAGEEINSQFVEYYLYNPAGIDQLNPTGVQIAADTVAYINSGLMDKSNKYILSNLHKAIKPLNVLRMIEDSLVIYRLARSSEKRVFNVEVGDLPRNRAEEFVKNLMNRMRRKILYDVNTGEVQDNKKFMTMMEDFWFPMRNGQGTKVDTLAAGCLAMNTIVPLLDGRKLTISEIAKEFNDGKKLWAYSCNPDNGEIVPGLISWAGITQKSAKVMRLTLDNGETIVCTPDHKFPVWQKGFVEAKDLEINESMIPFNNADILQSNHRIIKIEYLDNKIEVGTLTIDGQELYHNYHTFALGVGIFTKNSNLNDLADVDYARRNLYEALNVPITRLDPTGGFNLGRSSEITRDELKFTKFVTRLRKRFSTIFDDVLKTQLILKRIITPAEWEQIKPQLSYDWQEDNFFTEFKWSEIWQQRFATFSEMQNQIGIYISKNWVRENILHINEEEWEKIQVEIQEEMGQPNGNPMWLELIQQMQMLQNPAQKDQDAPPSQQLNSEFETEFEEMPALEPPKRIKNLNRVQRQAVKKKIKDLINKANEEFNTNDEDQSEINL